ncbi:MAG: MjaI family restriction endonuclease [Bacteroidaceae bacterium]|nr:MjaI family restriction endonuclease [Bacteroidaceae bacterium]
MARKRKTIVPDIQYKEGQNLFDLNSSPELPTYTSGFINDVNGWAGGSKAENVSQVSEVIKQFRENNPKGSLEDWISFHQGLEGADIQVIKGKGRTKRRETVKMAGIEQGVRDIMNKMEEVRNNINKLNEDMVRSWLKNLVYDKTFCGLEAQELILKDIAEKNGLEWMLGSMEDERQGIDGYVIDPNGPVFYPLQIKSSSYNNEHKPEHFICPVVLYDLIKEGINYKMPNNALVEPEESETWDNIKEDIRTRYNNRVINN